MARRPYFPFYVGDWRGSTKLRLATLQDRGAWVELKCLFHDSEEYGLLRWDLTRLADVIPCHVGILHSLVQLGILKGAATGEPFAGLDHTDRHGVVHRLIQSTVGPIWYSHEMVLDEHERKIASAFGKLGGNPALHKHSTLKGGINHPPYSSSSSSSSYPPPATPPSPGEPPAGGQITEPRAANASPVKADAKRKPGKASTANLDAGPNGLSTRPRDVIWDTVAETWFSGKVADPHRTRVGKLTRDFKALEASPDDIRTRLALMRQRWPSVEASPEALVKHWETFAVPNGTRGGLTEAQRVLFGRKFAGEGVDLHPSEQAAYELWRKEMQERIERSRAAGGAR